MNANWNQKSMNLSMYATLSRHIENSIQGQKTEEFLPELGEGLVIETGGGVCSGRLPIDSPADFYIAGSFDHLAKLKDGTYAVVDDKTSSAKPENLLAEKQSATYASQVNPYAYALEKPGDATEPSDPRPGIQPRRPVFCSRGASHRVPSLETKRPHPVRSAVATGVRADRGMVSRWPHG